MKRTSKKSKEELREDVERSENEVVTSEASESAVEQERKRGRPRKERTIKEILEGEALKIIGRKNKKERSFRFVFGYPGEDGTVVTLDNLISMRQTKLTIENLSNIYNNEEREIIRIFKRSERFNCLLVGDQVQMNDIITKIQLKMEDQTKDYYGIGKYFVFYLDANVFKKSIEETSVYKLVDSLRAFFAGMKILLVINNFESLVISQTSQDKVNSLVVTKMGELFQEPNLRIIATIDEQNFKAQFCDVNVIEKNFYVKEVTEAKYDEFRKFIQPSIIRILDRNSYIEEAAFEKLHTYAGLYEHYNQYYEAYMLIEDAAIIAKEKRRKKITSQDFDEVHAEQFRQVNSYSKDIVHRLAIHEAGHYIVYNHLRQKRFKLYDVVTVTILPIVDTALGFNQLSIDDPMLNDKKSSDADVLISLGGRAAEELFCNTMSDGCYGDLQSAVLQVESSFTYGVYDETQFRFVSMISADLNSSLILTPEEKLDFHKEVSTKINELYIKAKQILEKHADEVKALAKALEERKILSKAEIKRLLAEQKGSSKK